MSYLLINSWWDWLFVTRSCARLIPSDRDSHSFHLSPVEGGHGDVATVQKNLHTYNGGRGRGNPLCWQRKVLQ